MAQNLNDFSKDMLKYADSFRLNANKVMRITALEALKNLVFATPVDTGRARANWFAGINAPDLTQSENTNYAQNLGLQQTNILKVAPGQSIFLNNNLPYIQRLNDGWSGQAPSGFVQKAISAAGRAVARASKEEL